MLSLGVSCETSVYSLEFDSTKIRFSPPNKVLSNEVEESSSECVFSNRQKLQVARSDA